MLPKKDLSKALKDGTIESLNLGAFSGGGGGGRSVFGSTTSTDSFLVTSSGLLPLLLASAANNKSILFGPMVALDGAEATGFRAKALFLVLGRDAK